MKIHITENGSDQQTSRPARQRRGMALRVKDLSSSLNLFHARALLRLARRRPQIALGIAMTAVAAVGTTVAGTVAVATGVLTRMELHATVAPLAPAPHPPTPPVIAAEKHHRLLPHFHINPLAGLASWYGDVWNGRKTASGEDYDESLLTAAHKSLPLGTLVRVTNLSSMRSVIVRINDRGAFSPNRVIDLSSAAARQIGMLEQGLAHVRLEVLGRS